METMVCSLPYLNNANDTVLLNGARKVGELVLSQRFIIMLRIASHQFLSTDRLIQSIPLNLYPKIYFNIILPSM
jgi:hypothetical protein